MAEEQQQFDYHPDKAKATSKKTGSQVVSWTASEYIDHSRGLFWYVALGATSVVLAAIVYLLQRDIFATGVILLLGFIVAFAAARRPLQASYEVSSSGLKVGEKLYPYSVFKSFAVIHEGHLSSLIFTPLKRLQPPVSVFFEGGDEDKITSIIGEHLPYEQRSSDKIDDLSRRLRF